MLYRFIILFFISLCDIEAQHVLSKFKIPYRSKFYRSSINKYSNEIYVASESHLFRLSASNLEPQLVLRTSPKHYIGPQCSTETDLDQLIYVSPSPSLYDVNFSANLYSNPANEFTTNSSPTDKKSNVKSSHHQCEASAYFSHNQVLLYDARHDVVIDCQTALKGACVLRDPITLSTRHVKSFIRNVTLSADNQPFLYDDDNDNNYHSTSTNALKNKKKQGGYIVSEYQTTVFEGKVPKHFIEPLSEFSGSVFAFFVPPNAGKGLFLAATRAPSLPRKSDAQKDTERMGHQQSTLQNVPLLLIKGDVAFNFVAHYAMEPNTRTFHYAFRSLTGQSALTQPPYMSYIRFVDGFGYMDYAYLISNHYDNKILHQLTTALTSENASLFSTIKDLPLNKEIGSTVMRFGLETAIFKVGLDSQQIICQGPPHSHDISAPPTVITASHVVSAGHLLFNALGISRILITAVSEPWPLFHQALNEHTNDFHHSNTLMTDLLNLSYSAPNLCIYPLVDVAKAFKNNEGGVIKAQSLRILLSDAFRDALHQDSHSKKESESATQIILLKRIGRRMQAKKALSHQFELQPGIRMTTLAGSRVRDHTILFAGLSHGATVLALELFNASTAYLFGIWSALPDSILRQSTTTVNHKTTSGINNPILPPLIVAENQQDSATLFVTTQKEILKVQFDNCEEYFDCKSCLASRNPFCGWCHSMQKCTNMSLCRDTYKTESNANKPFDQNWLTFDRGECSAIVWLSPSLMHLTTRRNIRFILNHIPMSHQTSPQPRPTKYFCVFQLWSRPHWESGRSEYREIDPSRDSMALPLTPHILAVANLTNFPPGVHIRKEQSSITSNFYTGMDDHILANQAFICPSPSKLASSASSLSLSMGENDGHHQTISSFNLFGHHHDKSWNGNSLDSPVFTLDIGLAIDYQTPLDLPKSFVFNGAADNHSEERRKQSWTMFAKTHIPVFNCRAIKSCVECVSFDFDSAKLGGGRTNLAFGQVACHWCARKAVCTHDTSADCRQDYLINGIKGMGASARIGPSFCPRIEIMAPYFDTKIAKETQSTQENSYKVHNIIPDNGVILNDGDSPLLHVPIDQPLRIKLRGLAFTPIVESLTRNSSPSPAASKLTCHFVARNGGVLSLPATPGKPSQIQHNKYNNNMVKQTSRFNFNALFTPPPMMQSSVDDIAQNTFYFNCDLPAGISASFASAGSIVRFAVTWSNSQDVAFDLGTDYHSSTPKQREVVIDGPFYRETNIQDSLFNSQMMFSQSLVEPFALKSIQGLRLYDCNIMANECGSCRLLQPFYACAWCDSKIDSLETTQLLQKQSKEPFEINSFFNFFLSDTPKSVNKSKGNHKPNKLFGNAVSGSCLTHYKCLNLNQGHHQWLNTDSINDTCPNPVILGFEPKSSTLRSNNTLVRIYGKNLPSNLKLLQSFGVVSVAGFPCQIVSQSFQPTQSFMCRLLLLSPSTSKLFNTSNNYDEFDSLSGPITLHLPALHTTIFSRENFTFVEPYIEKIIPEQATFSGQTRVTMFGKHLDAGNEMFITLCNQPCTVIERSQNESICLTSPLLNQLAKAQALNNVGLIHMTIDESYHWTNSDSRDNPDLSFQYVPDPVVSNLDMYGIVPSGGTRVKVSGSGFTFVQEAFMVITYDVTNPDTADRQHVSLVVVNASQSCLVKTDNLLICFAPTLHNSSSLRYGNDQIHDAANSSMLWISAIERDTYQQIYDLAQADIVEYHLVLNKELYMPSSSTVPKSGLKLEKNQLLLFPNPVIFPFDNLYELPEIQNDYDGNKQIFPVFTIWLNGQIQCFAMACSLPDFSVVLLGIVSARDNVIADSEVSIESLPYTTISLACKVISINETGLMVEIPLTFKIYSAKQPNFIVLESNTEIEATRRQTHKLLEVRVKRNTPIPNEDVIIRAELENVQQSHIMNDHQQLQNNDFLLRVNFGAFSNAQYDVGYVRHPNLAKYLSSPHFIRDLKNYDDRNSTHDANNPNGIISSPSEEEQKNRNEIFFYRNNSGDTKLSSLLPSWILVTILAFFIVLVTLSLGYFIAYKKKSKKNDLALQNMKEQMNVLELRVAHECKSAFAELQTDMNEITNEVNSLGGIPFLDYKHYCMKVLFPNTLDHPILHDELKLEPVLNRAKVEKGLKLFHQLLTFKPFLLTFIKTLEADRYFSMKDRVNVASLIMIALHGKLDYCTDILKTLLKDLIDKSLQGNSHPKLLLRRTESVAEKMLTAWFTFLLYNFLRECVGEPLFLLFRAIKLQTDKGPVDVITHESKYSLSEEKLLRCHVDYQTLTIRTLVYLPELTLPIPNTDCGKSTLLISASTPLNHSNNLYDLSTASSTNNTLESCKETLRPHWIEIYVRVLDVDTISQVKAKILDYAFKPSTHYTARPGIEDLQLDWITDKGRVALEDEDLTCEQDGPWKKINTLQHYKIPCDATLSLYYKSSVSTFPREDNISTNFSLNNSHNIVEANTMNGPYFDKPLLPSNILHKNLNENDLMTPFSTTSELLRYAYSANGTEPFNSLGNGGNVLSSGLSTPKSPYFLSMHMKNKLLSDGHTVNSHYMQNHIPVKTEGYVKPSPFRWHLVKSTVIPTSSSSYAANIGNGNNRLYNSQYEVNYGPTSGGSNAGFKRRLASMFGIKLFHKNVTTNNTKGFQAINSPNTIGSNSTTTGSFITSPKNCPAYTERNRKSSFLTQLWTSSSHKTTAETSTKGKTNSDSLTNDYGAFGENKRDNREKMVTEIYLTRLLATKGTLQKFVDDLFDTIFSISHRSTTLPLAIKYMFDFLDSQAGQHNLIDATDVVHTWKSNSLPLRFWVNLIKNPDFILDICKTHTVDSCLSVIAQAFMDACSTTDLILTKDSPSSKLLYAKDNPLYKEWVEKYYDDIHMMTPVAEKDMSAYLRELSNAHANIFNSQAACWLLYTQYGSPYKNQLLTALDSEPLLITHQLAKRLNTVYDIIQSA